MRRAATPDTVGGIELDEGSPATDAALGQPQSPSSIINIDSVLAAPQAKRPFAQIPGSPPPQLAFTRVTASRHLFGTAEPLGNTPEFAAPHTRPPRRSLPRSDSAATLEVLERSGSGTLDGSDAPSESTSLDGDDALFDGLDDIVDVRGRRPNGLTGGRRAGSGKFEIFVNRVDNESAPRRPRCSY